MTLIGVISDTHDNIAMLEKAVDILRRESVDMVVHLGDIVAPFTLARLAGLLKGVRIEAIYGNNCGEKLGLMRVASNYGISISDPPKILEIEGRKILLIHGWGSADLTRRLAESLVHSGFWDAVLYGHTHSPDLRYVRGRLLLNPGEVAGVLERPSLAILEVENLKARIIELD